MRIERIAFTGFGGAGKDEAAKPLLAAGYVRRAFGDIIKGQVDFLVKEHLGFSAFTEDFPQKTKIRRTLEAWGEDNYDAIFQEFFGNLPERCVNTRLCREREALEWVKQGGCIWEVRRPSVAPATPWEQAQLLTLHKLRLVHGIIYNGGTVEELHNKVAKLADLPRQQPLRFGP